MLPIVHEESIALLCLFAITLFVYFLVNGRNPRRLPYPPGPKGHWLLGFSRFNSLPTLKPWLTYVEWGRKYRDLIHFTRFGHHYLIINSFEAADAILEKQARFTSDRPHTKIHKLAGWERAVSLAPYSEEWRRSRKLFHQNFRAEAALDFHPTQIEQVKAFLGELLVSPGKPLMDHISTLSQKIMFNVVYGLNISSNKEDMPKHARDVVELAESLIFPGWDAFMYIPFIDRFMSCIPARLYNYHQTVRKTIDELVDGPWNVAMSLDHPQSMISDLTSKLDANSPSTEVSRIKNMGFQAVSAAADTTMSAIGTFFLAMSLHQDAQRKAQTELDTVLGPGKLPTFADRSLLPFVEAIYREVMRWHPAIPLGLPHDTIEPMLYNGYYIPKGTTIYANIWAMTHDSSTLEKPNEFIPERHLRDDGRFDNINSILAYGFGRRVCVGRYMADNTIWITIASVLATMNISSVTKKDDESVESFYTDGTFCSPKSLSCTVTRRFPETLKL